MNEAEKPLPVSCPKCGGPVIRHILRNDNRDRGSAYVCQNDGNVLPKIGDNG